MSEARILENVTTHLKNCGAGYGSIEWKDNILLLDILEPALHEIHQGLKCSESQFDGIIGTAEMTGVFRILRHADEVGLKMSSYRIVWRFL